MHAELGKEQEEYDGWWAEMRFGLVSLVMLTAIAALAIGIWRRPPHIFHIGDYASPAFMLLCWFACFRIRQFVHRCVEHDVLSFRSLRGN
jgi:hypothetical protein